MGPLPRMQVYTLAVHLHLLVYVEVACTDRYLTETRTYYTNKA